MDLAILLLDTGLAVGSGMPIAMGLRCAARSEITAAHVNLHACRHCFTVTYIRNGGDIYGLSRILAYSSIATMQLYLRSMALEHLQEGPAKYSPLARLV